MRDDSTSCELSYETKEKKQPYWLLFDIIRTFKMYEVRMNKTERIWIKKIVIMIGVLVIGIWLLLHMTDMIGNQQPEGEYITAEDVKILLTALYPDIETMELYTSLSENAVEGNYITYGMYQKISTILVPEQEIMFSDIYRKATYYMTKEDWYIFFDKLCLLYDKDGRVREEIITVLATDEVLSEAGHSTENAVITEENEKDNKILVADKEIYRYESSSFEQTLYQPLTAVVKDDVLLTIKYVNDADYQLSNVWVMEVEEASIRCFWRNAEFYIPLANQSMENREQIADVFFKEGKPQNMKSKVEKVNGKLLAIRDGVMEIEGVGSIPVDDHFKIYKLYGTMESYYTSNLRIGYHFTDFVIEDGKICACLVTRDEAMENIRVLIQGSNYQSKLHEKVTLYADCAYEIRYYNAQNQMVSEKKGVDFEIAIDQQSQYLENGRMYIVPEALTGKVTISSILRSQGSPSYRGIIEIGKTDEGLVVINEVLLEEYLYAVVPSEMPASYPLEALKSQAICARTYAYRSMIKAGLPQYGAHVDDSTSYQVYNNTAEHAETTKAVKETAGELLYAGDGLIGAYYYSTSCGYGTNATIWKSGSTEDLSYLVPKRIGSAGDTEEVNAISLQEEETFVQFIKHIDTSDYESAEGWYRWSYIVESLEEEVILQKLQNRYEVNEKLILTLNGIDYISQPIEKLGKIKNIEVTRRGEGGIIDELVIEGEEATVKVISEHNVRYVLNNGVAEVVRQDGSHVAMPTLLPSAFFVIEPVKDGNCVVGYQLIGGGFGHGVGMSQNAARAMAVKGMTSRDILQFFYHGSKMKNIYDAKTPE